MLEMLLEETAKFFLYVILFVGGIAFFAWLIRRDRPLIDYTLSRWQQSIPGLEGTTTGFYAAVKRLIEEQEIPDVIVKTVPWHEGGILSTKRTYLRIRRDNLSFDLCVARFGQGLFISSWLCQIPNTFLDVLLKFPILRFFAAGWIKLFLPQTYFRVDSAAMFQDCIHACVLTVLDQMMAAQELEPLPEAERKPVMRDLYPPHKVPAPARA